MREADDFEGIETVSELQRRLTLLIDAWFGEPHDSKFYSHDEWLLRKAKEVRCDSADFHLTNSGDMADAMAFNTDFETAFNALVDRLGYHVEQGHPWSWHFWRLDTLDFEEQRVGQHVSVIQPVSSAYPECDR